MEINELYKLYQKYSKISTDSRKIEENSIFFALKGEKFDGNTYALQALQQGAAYCIIDNKQYATDSRCILVHNVLTTLQQLANRHRKELRISILAITGTNGKTTTKELVTAVLKKKYKVHSTTGNLNNHIGVPLTLLSMPFDTEFGVIEMGANHKEEIAKLCKIAEPDYGVITNVGRAHLEGFGSFYGVIQAKGELYEYINDNDGTIILNQDNDNLRDMAAKLENINKVTYGSHPPASCVGRLVSANPFLQVEWFVRASGKSGETHAIVAKTNLIGSYNFENVMAAVCVGKLFSIDPLKIVEAIENYSPDMNRSQLKKTDKNTVIIDCYNANPTSMTMAIQNFAEISAANKLLIIGDMLELGKDTQPEHLKIIKLLQDTHLLSNTLFVGAIFLSIINETQPTINQQVFANTELCKVSLLKANYSEHSILLKASRGIGLEKLIEIL